MSQLSGPESADRPHSIAWDLAHQDLASNGHTSKTKSY
jgi:hypothetical protein